MIENNADIVSVTVVTDAFLSGEHLKPPYSFSGRHSRTPANFIPAESLTTA
jgi:hypothetical protein